MVALFSILCMLNANIRGVIGLLSRLLEEDGRNRGCLWQWSAQFVDLTPSSLRSSLAPLLRVSAMRFNDYSLCTNDDALRYAFCDRPGK